MCYTPVITVSSVFTAPLFQQQILIHKLSIFCKNWFPITIPTRYLIVISSSSISPNTSTPSQVLDLSISGCRKEFVAWLGLDPHDLVSGVLVTEWKLGAVDRTRSLANVPKSDLSVVLSTNDKIHVFGRVAHGARWEVRHEIQLGFRYVFWMKEHIHLGK